MKNKNIFEKNAKIPDIVQQKANDAFATIYTRQDEPAQKPQKIHRSARATIIKIASTVVVAAVTVAVLLVTIAYFAGHGPELPGGSDQVTLANLVAPFTIRVCAAELEPETSLPISLDVSHQSFGYGGDWEGNANFQLNFPISVEGENISTVTFKAGNAVFEVVSIDGPSIVKSGSTKTLPGYRSTYVDGNDMSGYPIGKTIVGYYDSFSADYDTLQNSKYLFNVCNVLTDRMDLYYLLCYDGNLNDRCAAYTYLIKDVEVTIEVTFKDGTTASRSLGLFCKQFPATDKMEDGTEYTYTAMQVFCYDKNAMDEATEQLIKSQIARAKEIIKAEGGEVPGGDETTNTDEPVDNTDATDSTDRIVETDTSVGTVPTDSTETTVGTDATDSTTTTVGTDTPAGTGTPAGTEGTEATDEVSATENTDNTGNDG